MGRLNKVKGCLDSEHMQAAAPAQQVNSAALQALLNLIYSITTQHFGEQRHSLSGQVKRAGAHQPSPSKFEVSTVPARSQSQ